MYKRFTIMALLGLALTSPLPAQDYPKPQTEVRTTEEAMQLWEHRDQQATVEYTRERGRALPPARQFQFYVPGVKITVQGHDVQSPDGRHRSNGLVISGQGGTYRTSSSVDPRGSSHITSVQTERLYGRDEVYNWGDSSTRETNVGLEGGPVVRHERVDTPTYERDSTHAHMGRDGFTNTVERTPFADRVSTGFSVGGYRGSSVVVQPYKEQKVPVERKDVSPVVRQELQFITHLLSSGDWQQAGVRLQQLEGRYPGNEMIDTFKDIYFSR